MPAIAILPTDLVDTVVGGIDLALGVLAAVALAVHSAVRRKMRVPHRGRRR